MNRSKLHLLWNMAAALLLCMGFASCSQDDMQQTGGTPLPDGKYPLSLTATVGTPQTRAGGKDQWQGGEEIAVSIGNYTGKYTMDANGKATAAGAPYYWQNTTPATVIAWFPCDAQTNVDISDQSQGYAAFDFLYAETEGSYAAPVQLTFSHQMAKVSYTLVKGQGITDTELNAATVTLLGDKSVTVSGGKITAAPTSQTDEIKPCHDAAAHTGSAVVVPQDMTGKPLIKVSISGSDFIYTPSSEDAGNLQAGWQHSYTITVKANGIEVTAARDGEWIGDGSENVGITITYDGTETEVKTGDYYYADGTWSDGGLRKLYPDGTMEWAATKPQPVSDKTCIGIVFHVGQHPADQSDYTSTGIGQQKCHGYVVALKGAIRNCDWGVGEKVLGCFPADGSGNKLNNFDNPDIDWSGYAWTQNIITAAGGKDKLNATEEAGYPATWYAVVSYETSCNAPSNSSGWFLPSIGQMWKIYQNRSSLFDSVSGAEGFESDYWSSSEDYKFPMDGALYVNVDYGQVDGSKKTEAECGVRAILAF